MIEIRELIKKYGAVTALAGIDLKIQTGMFGLLGPNGAGKTTLMRILAGIVHPSGGSARIGGHDMSSEHGDIAAGLANILHDVCRENHNAIGREAREQIAESDALSRVEARGRLVNNQQVRIVHERLRDADPALHAS